MKDRVREHLNPKELYPPPGGLYSHAVRVGDTVYVSGQLARDPQGTVVSPGDVIGQFRQVWSNLVVALNTAGCTPRDLVKTTTYVVGAENIAAIRRVRRELLPKKPPASTMVVVAGLADPQLLVEVDAIAVLHSTEEEIERDSPSA
jgi:enamine deaminase RidA (YjgF/YER057c/UK114 family)